MNNSQKIASFIEKKNNRYIIFREGNFQRLFPRKTTKMGKKRIFRELHVTIASLKQIITNVFAYIVLFS